MKRLRSHIWTVYVFIKVTKSMVRKPMEVIYKAKTINKLKEVLCSIYNYKKKEEKLTKNLNRHFSNCKL